MSGANGLPYEFKTGTVQTVDLIPAAEKEAILRVVLNGLEPRTFLYHGKFLEAFRVISEQSRVTQCGVTMYYRMEVYAGETNVAHVYQMMFPGNDPQNPPVGGECV